MIKQLIPRITPEMLSRYPDQTTEILNRAIDTINQLNSDVFEIQAYLIKQKNNPEPTPPTPVSGYTQLLEFNPNRMGTTSGWCLRNVMQGFGLTAHAGGSANAYADMIYNKTHGTLHEEIYPPDDISVPIYIRTGSDNDHVVAWHHGVVYSDGVVISDWVNYYGAENIYGWGELCNTDRVVEKN